ncbi:MAG: FadR/GntR family transcriptional regulator [Chloroflexota bacterium]
MERRSENGLARQKLRDQLVELISDLIARKELLPGQCLPSVKELELKYGVSHTVVRETFGVLESRRLVDVRHGVGTFVNPPEEWDIAGPIGFLVRSDQTALLHWLEVRTAIEVEVAALAAERASADDLVILEQVAEGVLSPDWEQSTVADIAFHTQLALATGNPIMAKIVRPILQPMARSLVAAAGLPDSANSASAEHADVLRAVARHDQDGARRAMRQHLVRVRAEVEQVLRH